MPEAVRNWSEERKGDECWSREDMQNTKKVTVVELSGSRDELAQDVNWMRDVKASDPKVDKAPDKMAVVSNISPHQWAEGEH